MTTNKILKMPKYIIYIIFEINLFAFQVVVTFIDSELFQNFDEHLLKDYKNASEDGLNYYIAAELENEV